MGNANPKYDLEERTALFGEAIIDFAKTIPVNLITTPLIGQIVRSETSGEPITVKQTTPVQRRISFIESEFVSASRKKRNIGLA